MPKPKLTFFLLLFLLGDLVYTCYLHFHLPLDGDLAGILLPAPWYQAVLNDPFGLRILLEGESYAGAGRSFIHLFMNGYFRTVPFWLQSFLSPLDSIYAAAALLRTGIHLALVFLLAAYISGHTKIGRRDFLLAAVLVTPFFQTAGYYVTMGIVDRSVTYACFYALPMVLVLSFLLPFYLAWRKGQAFRPGFLQQAGLVVLAAAVALSGPLAPPVVMLVCPAVLVWQWGRHFRSGLTPLAAFHRIDPVPAGFFLLISLLGLYGWYLGAFNAESDGGSVPLAERYARMGEGLLRQLTLRLGWPLLLLLAGVNAGLLLRLPAETGAGRVRRVLLWVGLFTVAYLLLLPLGGFREYRSFIVRRDTMLPVTLGMVFGAAYAGHFLQGALSAGRRRWHLIFLAGMLMLFTLVDTPDFRHYRCERQALEVLIRSPEPVVRLTDDCTVLGWVKVREPGGSTMNVALLHFWGVLPGAEKRYYQE